MRYLISGYYGEGNAGDEAILAGILRALQSRDPEAEFTVLSFSPEDTERRHRVEAIPTGLRDPRPLLRALRVPHDRHSQSPGGQNHGEKVGHRPPLPFPPPEGVPVEIQVRFMQE